MSVYLLSAMKHNTTLLDGLQSGGVNPGAENLILGSDSNPYDTLLALMQQRPTLNYGTAHVDQHLDYLTTSGLATGENSLEAYFVQADEDGVRETTGMKFTIPKALIVPRTLSASQGQHATLAVEAVMRSSDGTTAPFSVAEGQTVPTADTVDEWFTLGPVTVNGADVGLVQTWSLDFGIDVAVVQGDGDLYPTVIYIRSIKPVITFDTLAAANLATWGIGGTNNVVTATLLKGANAGRAGSGDKVVTTAASRVTVQELSGSHNGESVLRCQAVCASDDGANHPITIS